MTIQYAGGTIVNATMSSPLGTRAELASFIRDQLVTAGWTSSGSATDYQVTSAITPQSLQGRVRVYDPGAGNCARLKWSNPAGSKTQAGDFFLLPAAAKTWRIIADKYQFFVMTPGTPGQREFSCGGIPYLPSFLSGVITEAIWAMGNAATDADTNLRTTFRARLTAYHASVMGSVLGICNGSLYETSSSVGSGIVKLVVPFGADFNTTLGGYLWHDDSQFVSDPLIAWGLTSSADIGKVRGQLWDAAVLSDSWVPDTTLQVDPANPTYNFLTITASNGGAAASYAPGTLCVRIS